MNINNKLIKDTLFITLIVNIGIIGEILMQLNFGSEEDGFWGAGLIQMTAIIYIISYSRRSAINGFVDGLISTVGMIVITAGLWLSIIYIAGSLI